MLKCLIVDDEVISREGVFEAIDWESLGIEVVGMAKNGQEGLTLFKKFSPEIVISDVKMPVMDGLTMVEQMMEARPKTKVLLLSAYSDFTYAQKAMRFGVKNYLLKPVDDDELLQAVTQLAEACRLDLVTDQDGRLRQLIEKETLPVEKGWGVFVIIQGVTPIETTAAIRVVAEGVYRGRFIQIVKVPLKDQLLFREKLESGFISSYITDGEVRKGYEEASFAASNATFWRLATLSWQKTMEQARKWTNTALMRNQAIENLLQQYPSHSNQTTASFLEGVTHFIQMLSQYQGIDGEDVWRYVYELFVKFDERYFILSSEEKRMETKQLLSATRDFDTLAETIRNLMTSTLDSAQMSSDFEIIRRIKQIIDERYAEDISSRSLAAEVFLSPNYMGKLFRDHTGYYLNDYLLEVRMKKARELLMTSQLSISEIAQAVGISSSSYFTSLFKKQFKQTPKAFRRHLKS